MRAYGDDLATLQSNKGLAMKNWLMDILKVKVRVTGPISEALYRFKT